jgi:hypothetical protein
MRVRAVWSSRNFRLAALLVLGVLALVGLLAVATDVFDWRLVPNPKY